VQGKDGIEANVVTIGVLECNRTAIAVYRSCLWDMLMPPMGGPLIHVGIRSTEVLGAMRIHGVPAKDRPDVDTRVRVMEAAAGDVYSARRVAAYEKQKAETESNRGRG
jgi:hypothetical protein